MTYKITPNVINIVEALFNEGYQGNAKITNSYCSGTASVLGKSFSVELTGFCKECLYMAESEDGDIILVGRYSVESRSVHFNVEDITAIAWSMYRSYMDIGYSRPIEFEDLFKKYGYLRSKTITKLIEMD